MAETPTPAHSHNEAGQPAAAHRSLPARLRRVLVTPQGITCLVLLLVLAAALAPRFDPLELAQIGTRFSQGDPQGSEGYDGQFVYSIATNPDPQTAARFLDVPAYRYQRILLPLLARVLGLGQAQGIAWALPLILVLAQAAGTWAVAELLAGWGINRWYALVYGLWAGSVLAVRVDLPEPLAYGLVAGALLAGQRNRRGLSWALYGLAAFAKEVTLLFAAAQLLEYLLARRWKDFFGLGLSAFLPFALFQLWLWATFGEPGTGSGGAMATPFEIIPFMGLLRIGVESPLYLLAMLVVFGPAVILPVLWGLWRAGSSMIAGERNVLVLAVGLNALAIVFLPYSTFRETGGLLRFACGPALALLLAAGRWRHRRALRYSPLWLVLNVFLLKG